MLDVVMDIFVVLMRNIGSEMNCIQNDLSISIPEICCYGNLKFRMPQLRMKLFLSQINSLLQSQDIKRCHGILVLKNRINLYKLITGVCVEFKYHMLPTRK